MSDETISTRRAFLKGGAIVAAPLAMVGAPAAAFAADDRIGRLEDEAAIRALHQSLMRHINGGRPEAAASLFARPRAAALDESIQALATDHAGDVDAIDIAADGRSATGRFACLIETGAMLPMDNILAQMADVQGTAFVRESGRAVMTAGYVKTEQGWAIAHLDVART